MTRAQGDLFLWRVAGWLTRLLPDADAHYFCAGGPDPVWVRFCGDDTACLVGATCRAATRECAL